MYNTHNNIEFGIDKSTAAERDNIRSQLEKIHPNLPIEFEHYFKSYKDFVESVIEGEETKENIKKHGNLIDQAKKITSLFNDYNENNKHKISAPRDVQIVLLIESKFWKGIVFWLFLA